MITYYAEIEQLDPENGVTDTVEQKLAATTENAAREETILVAKANPGKQVYCAFHRDSDGQKGYINRDGADVMGRAY